LAAERAQSSIILFFKRYIKFVFCRSAAFYWNHDQYQKWFH